MSRSPRQRRFRCARRRLRWKPCPRSRWRRGRLRHHSGASGRNRARCPSNDVTCRYLSPWIVPPPPRNASIAPFLSNCNRRHTMWRPRSLPTHSTRSGGRGSTVRDRSVGRHWAQGRLEGPAAAQRVGDRRREAPGPVRYFRSGACGANAAGARALVALLDLEGDGFAAGKAVEVQRRVKATAMEEVLLSILGGNEAESTVALDPFDCPIGGHILSPALSNLLHGARSVRAGEDEHERLPTKLGQHCSVYSPCTSGEHVGTGGPSKIGRASCRE